MKLIIVSALFLLILDNSSGATPTPACFDSVVGGDVFNMPEAFAGTKGTRPLFPATNAQFKTPEDFAGKKIRFGDEAIFYLKRLLGYGNTAAVFELDSDWALRLNSQMEFLEGFVRGQQLCEALGIPTVEIRRKQVDGATVLDHHFEEYIVVRRYYPKHFERELTEPERASFGKATALHLYANWERLDPIERETAHNELKTFMRSLAPFETYFDFQPSNVVRTTAGWILMDPSFAGESFGFATRDSKVVPFAFPTKDNSKRELNWLTDFGFSAPAKFMLEEHIRAILERRRNHWNEIGPLVEFGKEIRKAQVEDEKRQREAAERSK